MLPPMARRFDTSRVRNRWAPATLIRGRLNPSISLYFQQEA
jgi:hypothetical protein